MSPGAIPHATESAHNIFSDAAVVGELAAKFLHHTVDVVELSLVTGGRGHGDPSHHVCAVHAVHHVCILVL